MTSFRALAARMLGLLLVVSAPVFAEPAGAMPLTVFMVAHPDDWQLFMGDVASAKVAAGGPVIFVYLTAGGADRPAAYWQARESGSNASAYAAASVGNPDTAETYRSDCSEVRVGAHALQRCSYRNTVSYYLRLPDGAFGGEGFAQTGFASMAKLAHGEIETITAVDASAKYRNWPELANTLERLLAEELKRSQMEAIELHSHDPDATINPNDHADHRATGELAAELATRQRSRLTFYAGYATSQRPANLSAAAVAAKMLTFMSYDRQCLMADEHWSAYGEGPQAYSSWLFRTYSRSAERD